MIYTELNEYDMQKMLADADRDNFSLDALRAYISFIEEIGENTEFYPVDFDCAYVEFDLNDKEDIESFINDYGYLVEGDEYSDQDDLVEALKEAIHDNTLVISNDDGCFMFDYNF